MNSLVPLHASPAEYHRRPATHRHHIDVEEGYLEQTPIGNRYVAVLVKCAKDNYNYFCPIFACTFV